MSPEEQKEWDAFVEAFRREAVEKISGSAGFLSLIPESDDIDVKFCVELGAAIMMNKPIIAVVHKGRTAPEKLAKIADEIVYADLDTTEGQKEVAMAIRRVVDDG